VAPRECETVNIDGLLLFQLESSFNSFCAQTKNKRRKSMVETIVKRDGWMAEVENCYIGIVGCGRIFTGGGKGAKRRR
jgi:hypothetical protein